MFLRWIDPNLCQWNIFLNSVGAGGCECSLSNRNRMCIEHDRAEVDSVSIGISNRTTFTDFNRSTSSTLSKLPNVCDVTSTNQSSIGWVQNDFFLFYLDYICEWIIILINDKPNCIPVYLISVLWTSANHTNDGYYS